jgi:1-acyl-sn-glycerol-3-phosphate acyltransferase
MPVRPRYKRWGYNAIRVFCRLAGVAAFGLRVFGRQHAPRGGAALICANHQSHFDPLIVGLAIDVRINTLARRTLFDVPLLKQMIEYLDAIPIERDGMALSGIKITLQRLKQNEPVLLFPEGTRSRDGEVAPLKPGFVTLARRAAVPLVPVGFDGAYQAWPRTRNFPWFSRIVVVIGPPITPAEFRDWSAERLVEELERRIRACHAEARRRRLGNRKRGVSP